MDHFISPFGNDISRLRSEIFPKIASGETILFLGAGASVNDEKKYLSSDIMEYYSDKKGIALRTNDITDFVDTLSAKPDFDRNEFDEYVAEMLKKYQVTETHRTIASIPWKEIITTNFDLLIEKAFDEVEGTIRETSRCKPVRQLSDYHYRPANDEVKYVKLNGCLIDKRKYKLVFSTNDFRDSKKYYNAVLKSLENLSYKINLLSVGYSYSDAFAKSLLERFDSFNFRNKRWLYNVDPFVETDRLPYFAERRICVIKGSAAQLFEAYTDWEKSSIDNRVSRQNVILETPGRKAFAIDSRVRQRINGNLMQLIEGNSFRKISAGDFYSGEEPNYQVIVDNHDVVKQEAIDGAVAKVRSLVSESGNIIPTLILDGSFGTGKSTLSYRVVENLIRDPELNAIAFEVLNADALSNADLEEVFAKANASTIVLFFNGIELDTAFKSLTRLRNRLSVEQLSSIKIVFLASMRENILAEFLREHEYKNFHTLNVDREFSNEEAEDLVLKLRSAGIVKFRDAKEKNELIEKVVNDYEGDTLVALIGLVSEGSHNQTIRDAYSELTEDAKKVFLFTSLLYRFGILMPASLLRRLIEMSWDEFAKDIIPYNFKNFIQRVEHTTRGTDPDLFFKTRHPIISEKIVEMLLPSEDDKLEKYEFMFRRMTDSHYSAELVVNLLKALRHNADLSETKIDRLFDISGQEFHEDTQFNLHYAINLQHRNTEDAVRKGIERITYAESFLEGRNHRLIHRKAVLNFQLAKLLYEKEGFQLKETFKYLDRAQDFFEIKLIMDPFSSYSYVNYLHFEIWRLEKLKLSDSNELHKRIKIEELLNQAENAVVDDLGAIIKVKSKYLESYPIRGTQNGAQYEAFLSSLCRDAQQKPFGLVLSFYYFQESPSKAAEIVKALEEYQYLDDAAKILFKYYGRNLHLLEVRLKFMALVKRHPFLEKTETARYFFYSFINEVYNGHFESAYEYLGDLRSSISFLNPEIKEVWRNADNGEPTVFEGHVVLKQGRWKKVKIPELQRAFDLKGKAAKELAEGTLLRVHLHFHLSGIKAEICES